jgi:hypothetical protein
MQAVDTESPTHQIPSNNKSAELFGEGRQDTRPSRSSKQLSTPKKDTFVGKCSPGRRFVCSLSYSHCCEGVLRALPKCCTVSPLCFRGFAVLGPPWSPTVQPYCTVLYGIVPYGTSASYGKVPYRTVRYSTVRYGTVTVPLYRTVPYGTVRYRYGTV